MINLSDRLKEVADFVSLDSKGIIDVGCDHALLSIYLKEKNSKLKVIASDLREGPLKKATKNIDKYNLTNDIFLVKADGLDSYQEGIDTVIISGMGTKTIEDILTKGKEKLKDIKYLIISSNNKYEELRRFVTSLGYLISKEKIVFESNKYYIIIKFSKGTEEYSKKEFLIGPYLINNKDELFYKYYENILSKHEKIFIHNKDKEIVDNIKILTEILNS